MIILDRFKAKTQECYYRLFDKAVEKQLSIISLEMIDGGQFLNSLSPHKLFQIHQSMLIIMLIVQILVLKRIKEIENI